MFIEPGSPWAETVKKSIQRIDSKSNGHNESFNGKLRNELLNVEHFDGLREAKVLTERSRRNFNTIRPHTSLSYQPPAAETKVPTDVAHTRATFPPDQPSFQSNAMLT